MATSPPLPAGSVRFARTTAGDRIAWATGGRGPALVRVAHWMTHVEFDLRSSIWRPIVQRASRQAALVRYDDTGCGLSPPSGRPPSLEDSLQALDAVVRACGDGPVSLWGLSAGGATAIAYAARHPERVDRLVLLGAFARGLMHHEPTPEQLRWREAVLSVLVLGWGRRHAGVQQMFTGQMFPGADLAQLRDFNEQQRLSCSGAQAAALYRAATELDVRPLLSGVCAPTLVAHCDGDPAVPIESARELAAGIGGARLLTLASRNHLPLPGEPAFEVFFEAMDAFIGLPAAPAAGFSARERALLALVARGLDNLQIAAQLGVAEKTVRNAMSALYARLGVEGRPQAVARARDLGFG